MLSGLWYAPTTPAPPAARPLAPGATLHGCAVHGAAGSWVGQPGQAPGEKRGSGYVDPWVRHPLGKRPNYDRYRLAPASTSPPLDVPGAVSARPDMPLAVAASAGSAQSLAPEKSD